MTRLRRDRPFKGTGRKVLAAASFSAVACLVLGGCERGAASAPGLCWISRRSGEDWLLAEKIPNLETCGARLEVMYLIQKRPIHGAYGGLFITIDYDGIFAQAPNGPPARLFDPSTRRVLDRDIQLLIARRRMTGDEAPKPPR